jgi:hypothetical protein
MPPRDGVQWGTHAGRGYAGTSVPTASRSFRVLLALGAPRVRPEPFQAGTTLKGAGEPGAAPAMFEGLRAGRRVARDLEDDARKVHYGVDKPGTCSPHGPAVAGEPTRWRRRQADTGFGIVPLRAAPGRNKPMYIGIGTVVLIVIIVLVVLMLRRRLCPGA